jgi:MoaA/NifB/PqqE/SkfB family radical SAM enzyme
MDQIRSLIDAAADKSFQAVSFTGGEPLLFPKRLAQLIQYAGNAGIPYIRTGTNGFVFRNPERPGFEKRVRMLAESLTATPLRNFWISIDSYVDDVHEQMRGFSGVMRGIEKALPIFHDLGLYPSANLGINRNISGSLTRDLTLAKGASEKNYLDEFEETFYQAFCRFFKKVVEMGFTIANACYPMSIDIEETNLGLQAVYPASASENIVRFSRPEKARLFASLMRAVQANRSVIRIFSPLCSLYSLMMSYQSHGNGDPSYACRGGIDFFFIDSKDGHAYPCGYRGNEDLGFLQDLDVTLLGQKVDRDHCTLCDWECFRDPSELLGPVMTAVRTPWRLLSEWFKRPQSQRLWWQDICYYRACDFFDGRQPIHREKLQRFRQI